MQTIIRSRFLTFLVAAGLVALFSVFLPAPRSQAAVNVTTLSNAITATQQVFSVASGSGASVGDLAVVDHEAMAVTAVSGNTLTVRRGHAGAAVAHEAGSTIYIDAPSYFSQVAPYGSCTSTAEVSAPRIVLPSFRIFECQQSRWRERVNDPVSFSAGPVFQGKTGARDSFDQGYLLMMDTGVVQALTDDLDTFVYGSPLGAIEFREELTKTVSSWVTSTGKLDIAADNTTDDEGVEIIFGASELNGAYFVAGSTGACISASITLTDISGTDQLLIGFRDSTAFLDVNAYASYTIWHVVGVNNVDGSIFSLNEVSSATGSDDSGVNMADGETRAFKVCVNAAGVPSAFYSAAVTVGSHAELNPTYIPITLTNGGRTLTANQAMVPFLTYMAAGTDGPNPLINWVQLEPWR